MKMSTIKLNKDELNKINELMDKFPGVDSLTLVTTNTGVGQTLDILFDTHYNGVPGVFKVDLTDTSGW